MQSHKIKAISSVSNPLGIPVALVRDWPGEIQLEEILPDALQAIRTHLGMEVAFISRFVNGQREFVCVNSSLHRPPIEEGDSDPLEQTYCQRVVDGRLPEMIHDATQLPAARELSVTTSLPIGAHLSVPIKLPDGSIYGTLCCFSTTPDRSLTERDLSTMHALAEFASRQIYRRQMADRDRREAFTRIQSVLNEVQYSLVYQPILQIEPYGVVGVESLARFSAEPQRTPDVWFKEAAEVGLGEQLEIAVVRLALERVNQLPRDVYLSLNVSPVHILTGAISKALDQAPLDRVVLEVTEHEIVNEYAAFGTLLDPLRASGLKLAIDDAGAGYANFRHILQLAPDIIKLDISLTRNIDTDRKRRCLAAALIAFAKETGSRITAEGVETESELRVLRELQVDQVQGYLLGRPMSFDALMALLPSPVR